MIRACVFLSILAFAVSDYDKKYHYGTNIYRPGGFGGGNLGLSGLGGGNLGFSGNFGGLQVARRSSFGPGSAASASAASSGGSAAASAAASSSSLGGSIFPGRVNSFPQPYRFPQQYGFPGGQYNFPGVQYGLPGQYGFSGQYGFPGQIGFPGPFNFPGQQSQYGISPLPKRKVRTMKSIFIKTFV